MNGGPGWFLLVELLNHNCVHKLNFSSDMLFLNKRGVKKSETTLKYGIKNVFQAHLNLEVNKKLQCKINKYLRFCRISRS